jgi:hypothetical protein
MIYINKNNQVCNSTVERRIEQYIGVATSLLTKLLSEFLAVEIFDVFIINFIPLPTLLDVTPVMSPLDHTSMHYHTTKIILAVSSAFVIYITDKFT